MKKVIHLDKLQLKCDAPGCGHHESADLDLAKSGALIGKPCPSCGASLLTKEDHAAGLKMWKWIDIANKWLGPIFGTETPEPQPGAISATYSVNLRANSVHIQKKV